MSTGNQNLYKLNAGILQKDACIFIIHTEWNAPIVDRLVEGCVNTLRNFQMNNFKLISVPGAFEIPFGIRTVWENYRNKFEKPQCFIALGCVLRGETPHFEYVSRAVTDGIMNLNLTLPVPTVFGVLTVDNEQQAADRLGGRHGHKGNEAALTALRMMELRYG